MTTDDFTEAARAEADERWPRLPHDPSGHYLNMGKRVGFELGASWARDHYAAQEPTDAECLAVLNVAIVPLGEPPKRNGLADWNPAAVERVRAALSAARAARRDEKDTP